jgi:IclR family transcriptional regulator, pca regulon regulatory protein
MTDEKTTDENGLESAVQTAGSATFVRSVARALKVISGFGVDAPAQTLAQVAARNGLDRATARRVLLTLEELGYVRREARQFSLTPRVLELGFAYMSSLPFWSVADDVLKELADSLHVFCLIVAIDSSYETVWVVSSVRARDSLPLVEFPNTGRHTPSHRVAPGIILLGGLSGHDLNRALLACTARDEGVSLPALRERVIQARLQGWSLRVVPAENFTEIAVPLLDAQGRIIASMSVLCPLSKVSTEEAVKQYLPRIKQAAEEINTLVGYKTPGP